MFRLFVKSSSGDTVYKLKLFHCNFYIDPYIKILSIIMMIRNVFMYSITVILLWRYVLIHLKYLNIKFKTNLS
jgi:hypothetical protein